MRERVLKTKVCIKCNKRKKREYFVVNKGCKDGIEGVCKKCTATRMDKYYSANKEQVKRNTKNWQKNNRIKLRKYQTIYREHNPGNLSAYTKLHYAVAAGKIKKPNKCEICGDMASIVCGHHENYKEPTRVVWVCHQCHTDIHSGDIIKSRKVKKIYQARGKE